MSDEREEKRRYTLGHVAPHLKIDGEPTGYS